jgi:hypothetical protein
MAFARYELLSTADNEVHVMKTHVTTVVHDQTN